MIGSRGRSSGARASARTSKGFFSFLNPFDRRDTSFVTGGVGAGEGLVILGTTHAEVIALSAADGSEKWRVRVSSEVLSTPATGDGLVFVQTSDGRLVALEAKDGARRWTFDTPVPVLTLRGTGSPVYSSGVSWPASQTAKSRAFRASTGEPLWDQRVMLPQGRSELDRIVDVDGTPVITANAVYAASFQGRLSAIRPSDGTVLWEHDASSYVDLAQGSGNVYVVDDKSVITAIDQRTSSVAWEQRALFKRGLSGAAAVGSYLVVGDEDGFIHVLSQIDGHLRRPAQARWRRHPLATGRCRRHRVLHRQRRESHRVSHRAPEGLTDDRQANHAECDRARRPAERRQVDAVQSVDAASRRARCRCAGTDARPTLRRRRIRRQIAAR